MEISLTGAADTTKSWSGNWISRRLRASAVNSLYRVSVRIGERCRPDAFDR